MITGLRRLPDDTLLVFLSDTHIGGDQGVDIFESADELATLFEELSEHEGRVELVLAGDAFDFLRMSTPHDDHNRAEVVLAKSEYRSLFDSWRRLGCRQDCSIIYLPGNHDAEAWWNADIQSTLIREGLVSEFSLSYAAAFDSQPDDIIYCEHGNQFDPTNAISDYGDPHDTPLGDHIVTDLVRRLSPLGRIGWNLNLRDASYVFPLITLPAWIVGRIFYSLLTWVGILGLAWAAALIVVPIVALLVFDSRALPDPGPFWPGTWWRAGEDVGTVFVEIGWDLIWLLVLICLFYVAVQRTFGAAVGFLSTGFPGIDQGNAGEQAAVELLMSDRSPPMRPDIPAQSIKVFVSGHSHLPSLREFRRDGSTVAAVNTGCWLRQLQPIPAHLGGPPVFVSRFVQSHIRLLLHDKTLFIELRQKSKASGQNLTCVERLATLGRREQFLNLDEDSKVTRIAFDGNERERPEARNGHVALARADRTPKSAC